MCKEYIEDNFKQQQITNSKTEKYKTKFSKLGI